MGRYRPNNFEYGFGRFERKMTPKTKQLWEFIGVDIRWI